MFDAILVTPYEKTALLTKGRTYRVIDFNDYFGTYTIINDAGERANVHWWRFADMGRASTEYQRNWTAA